MAIELPALVGYKDKVQKLLDVLKEAFDINGKVTITVDKPSNAISTFPLSKIMGMDIKLELADPTIISYEFVGDVCDISLNKSATVTIGRKIIEQPIDAVKISIDRIYFDIPRFFDVYADVR
jgi:hypothetical protein